VPRDAAPILVLGATGNVGRHVVEGLLAAGVSVRAGVRDPAAAAGGTREGAEVVRLDVEDPTSFPTAVNGARGLFLMRPPAVSRVGPTLNVLIDAAASAGIGHIVFLSVAGADRNPVVPHHRVERHLASSFPSWTALRPGFFAQNLGDAYRRDILEEDRIIVPAGRGRAAFVDVRDVGDVAARILLDPEPHRRRGYELTGTEPLSFTDVAATLSAVLGRPITYEAATVLRYARRLHARGLPMAQVAVQTVLHVGLRFGQAERVTGTLERLLGRPARTLATYVDDHQHLWRAGGAAP